MSSEVSRCNNFGTPSVLSCVNRQLDSKNFPIKKRILKALAQGSAVFESQVRASTSSWQQVLTRVEGCKKTIIAKEAQNQCTYSDYAQAAEEFSQDTDSVKAELCTTFFSPTEMPEVKLDALKKFSQATHPFPVNHAIYIKEKDLLQKALLSVIALSKDLAVHKVALALLREELETRTTDIEFNFAYFFSCRVLEKFEAFQKQAKGNMKPVPDILEEATTLAGVMFESIENYKKVESLYSKALNFDAANVCRDSIAAGIERLADHYFDASQLADPITKAVLLNQAIETYQSMKKYVKPLPEAIIKSIFEARYLAAVALMEAKNTDECKGQLVQLREEMKLHLKNEDYLTWPTASLYNLESLSMLYEITKDVSFKKQALKEINWLKRKQSKWPKEAAVQLQISSWISKAERLFK